MADKDTDKQVYTEGAWGVGGGGGGGHTHTHNIMTVNLKNRLLMVHIPPSDFPDYKTFRHSIWSQQNCMKTVRL